MYKKYFAIFLLSSFVCIPAFAQDAVFSDSETQQFNLQPLDYSTKPVVNSSEVPVIKSSAKPAVAAQTDVSNTNFLNAINNLDNAQVELREQMASYNALMEQSKAEYQLKKDEYKAYKKQYNAIKKKMRKVERSKNMIQDNIQTQDSQN